MAEKSPSAGWKETNRALEVPTTEEQMDHSYGRSSSTGYDMEKIDLQAEYISALSDGSAERSTAVLGKKR